MKQKISLLIGLVALVVIVLFLIKKPTPNPNHNLLAGTCKVLRNEGKKLNLKQYHINFYMENSASMDGYVNGNTSVRDKGKGLEIW